MTRRTRRHVLGRIGAGSLAVLAGCTGPGGTDTGTAGDRPSSASGDGRTGTETPTATLTPPGTATASPTASPSPTPAASPSPTPHEVSEWRGSASGNEFGTAVAIDGDAVLVGQPYGDPDGRDSGSAVVFRRTESGWQRRAKLAPGSDRGRHHFGFAIALDGDTAVVGAPLSRGFAGRAHVFERSGSGWSRVTTLDPGKLGVERKAGITVALAGGLAVVGAPGAGGDDPPGAAYVYERSGDDWARDAKLTASDGDENDGFGLSVAATGETVVVGAPNDEDPAGTGNGSAYVFTRSADGWSERAKLSAGDAGDHLGTSLAVADGTVLAGAEGAATNGNNAGAVHVFERSDGRWTNPARLVPGDGDERDRFGSAVSTADDVVVVGARTDEDPTTAAAGSAYVFERSGGDWTQRTKLAPSDGTLGANFGAAVSTTGEVAVVGAPLTKTDGTETGAAYLFAI